MKRMLATALAFAAMASAANAQEMEQQIDNIAIRPQVLPKVEKPAYGIAPAMSVNAAVESDFIWNSIILRRYGSGGDSNRRDLTVPLLFDGGTQMRGFGQIFAPRYIYNLYNGSIYTDESDYIARYGDVLADSFATDKEYIAQFLNARNFSLQAVVLPFYHNPEHEPVNPGLLSFLKSTFNFGGTNYRNSGYRAGRRSLAVAREVEIDQDMLDNTTFVDDVTGNTLIRYTAFEFLGEEGSEDAPIQFAQNESLVMLYTNEFSPAVSQPIPDGDTREWQRVIASDEYREGDFVEDPSNPGQVLDQRRLPLEGNKLFGVVMYREGSMDTIATAWTNLFFGDSSAKMNLNVTFYGVVELAAGVRYHFGRDASSQGIGAVTPNPVREKASIPFSLTERSHAKIELFDMSGQMVRTLADGHYIQGNYSVDLETNGLANGSYLLRMTAGEKVYTQKLNVTR